MQRSPWRYLVHILVGGYLISAFLWSMPEEIPLKRRVDRFVSPAFQTLGLWQNWRMFAPQPRSEDVYVTATTTLADGRSIEWNLSGMWKMSFFERYRKERWRKFFNDYIRNDNYKNDWPAVSRWVIRSVAVSETSPPVKVELWRHWRYSKPGLIAEVKDDEQWHAAKFYDFPESPKTPDKKRVAEPALGPDKKQEARQ